MSGGQSLVNDFDEEGVREHWQRLRRGGVRRNTGNVTDEQWRGAKQLHLRHRFLQLAPLLLLLLLLVSQPLPFGPSCKPAERQPLLLTSNLINGGESPLCLPATWESALFKGPWYLGRAP